MIAVAGIVKALGGVRGTIFAGLALVLLIAVGVQTWRLHSAEADVAKLEGAAAQWRAAQSTNLGTIAILREKLVAITAARARERREHAAAVDRAQDRAEALAKSLTARTAELERLYASDPNAARWGRAAVPAGVLRQLPDAD